MRTYRYGSRRLEHEANATVPQLRWLGIVSDDIFNETTRRQETSDISHSQTSQDTDSQETASQVSVTYSFDGELIVFFCTRGAWLTELLARLTE
jgi:DNA topoisomerase VI subunit A